MSTLKKLTTGIKMENKKEIRSKAAALEPIVRIGKSGLSESVVEEIKKHLKQKKIVKIKMLRAFVGTGDKKDFAKQIADKTDSTLVHRVGFVVVLAKKSKTI